MLEKSTSVKVKICGLTTLNDIDILNANLPDYAGFVFAPSRRRISPELATHLIAQLHSHIRSVGVFSGHSITEIIEIAKITGLDVIQLHGQESPKDLELLRQALPERELWKAHPITGREGSDHFMRQFDADRHVVDTRTGSCSGGSGQCFDWNAAEYLINWGCRLSDTGRPQTLILAGGLNADNLMQAIHHFNPYGIDVSSGVETDGQKDPRKIEQFMSLIRPHF